MKRLLRLLNGSGDTRISYDLEDPSSLAEAKAAWNTAIAKGASAFSVKPGSDETSKRLTNFDEASEETVIVPKIVGG